MKSNTEKNIVGGKSLNNRIPKSKSEYAGTIVKIKDYDPANHLVKVVRASDNKPLEKDYETQQEVVQKKPYDQPTSRVIKSSTAADAPLMEVNDSSASLRGNADYGFFSFREGGGNIIKGPLSIGAPPNQVRMSGLHTFNPVALSGFPSTIVTPIPTFLWALPATAIIKPLLKDVTIMGTLVSALG